MSVTIIKRYYRVESEKSARDALQPLGLADADRWISTPDTTVDWLGQTYNPPAQYDDEGNETEPGTDQGILLNVYSRDQNVIDTLDGAFERREPTTPIRDLAGSTGD